MGRIDLSYDKTLKLSNVLIHEVFVPEVTFSSNQIEQAILQMENYMRSKGVRAVGPLIQKNISYQNEDGQTEIKMFLMRQANNYINHVDCPYKFAAVLRVKNCLYARYTGPGETLRFAYDKIKVTAFEEDIELTRDNYTVFVDQRDDIIIADIFVERA